MASETTRGRGRPALPAERLKRKTVGVRMRDSTSKALADRATANRRSISEEIEAIVDRAIFEGQVFEPAVLIEGHRMLVAFSGGLQPGKIDDPEAYERAMVRVWESLLRHHPGRLEATSSWFKSVTRLGSPEPISPPTLLWPPGSMRQQLDEVFARVEADTQEAQEAPR